MAEQQNTPVVLTTKGMDISASPEFQPEGTSKFNLNVVNESETGNTLMLSNERSNQLQVVLTDNMEIISSIYIGLGKIALFCCNPQGVSEIGIFDEFKMEYETVINDAASLNSERLNFSLEYPIDLNYRLRRGCERTIYFTDYNNPPSSVNLDAPEKYKNLAGRFERNKFRLQRLVNQVPLFQTIEVLNYGGNLAPGSYNISIQYVDEDFNPTEFITSSEIIIVYNDDTSKNFVDIQGTIKKVQEDNFLDFPLTTKAISVVLDGLDTDFPYYRLALIEANVGSGNVSKVSVTDVIPTNKKDYILTGTNTPFESTEQEVLQVVDIIEKARHITQIDNTLILGETQGSQINYCELQKYASKITTDCVTKKVLLNSMDDINNPKSPIHNFNGVGYMPGEIYALGIVYVFEGNEESPVMHIPGKPANVANSVVYRAGTNVYGMNNKNACESTLYTENDTCDNFWGVDGNGNLLTNRKVRHHRMPTRKEIGIPLVKEESSSNTSITFYQLRLTASGNIQLFDGAAPMPVFYARVVYNVAGEQYFTTLIINPAELNNPINLYIDSQRHLSNDIQIVEITEDANDGNTPWVWSEGEISPKGLNYQTSVQTRQTTQNTKIYSSEILGLQFSNIELPPKSLTGKECLGYYIVRAERTQDERTILDSGVIVPTVKNSKYISHGLLNPEFTSSTDSRIDSNIFGLIHPEHKFNSKDIRNFTEISHEGNFIISNNRKSKIAYQDIIEGTSYDPENHDKSASDDDGFDLNCIVRDTELTYQNYTAGRRFVRNDVEDTFYLDALDFKDINNGQNTVYNISADNKIGFLRFKSGSGLRNFMQFSYPYLLFKKENANPYSNFRNIEYYKEHTNISTTDFIHVYSGDSYLSPMRYVSTTFWENRLALRKGKSSFWKKVLGGFLIVAGAVISIFTGGLAGVLVAVGAGLLVAGAGTLLLSAGIKQDKWNKAYLEEYDKGLRETALDNWVDYMYRKRTLQIGNLNFTVNLSPGDDSIQWIGESLTDLWFETSINTNLRHGTSTGLPTHLNAPGVRESGNQTNEPINNGVIGGGSLYAASTLEFHLLAKLTYFDPDKKDGRAYYGHPLAEYYAINPDYQRENKQKIHFPLGIEYECCSDCRETFSQRLRYSLQSFQEELTDNYKVFLPNNYRDIPGEFGAITNLFTMGNNLFVHTEEGLWSLPRNYQERVTDQVVSFIGTGSFFEIPPNPILDTQGDAGGTTFKFANVKTQYGYFFASNKSLYKFDGQNLTTLTDIGLKPFFDKYLKIYGDTTENLQEHITVYSNPDNPLVSEGVGYCLGFDKLNKRILFTKIDMASEQDNNWAQNKSWTLSFDLKTNSFISFHSYFPTHYIKASDSMLAVSRQFKGGIYMFNKIGEHNNFFGKDYPSIVEYIIVQNPIQEFITDNLLVNVSFEFFDNTQREYYLNTEDFFDQAILYNSKQITGTMDIANKNDNVQDFFGKSIRNANLENIYSERVGGNWFINNFRDIASNNKAVSMFITKPSVLQSNWFIDKEINPAYIDISKDWNQREPMRDKYLVARFIFNKFAKERRFILKLTSVNQTLSIE